MPHWYRAGESHLWGHSENEARGEEEGRRRRESELQHIHMQTLLTHKDRACVYIHMHMYLSVFVVRERSIFDNKPTVVKLIIVILPLFLLQSALLLPCIDQ